MHRNVRMVLILVDGRSTVADLCWKTGNSQLTENALVELEEEGYIECGPGQRDSRGKSEKKQPSVPAVPIAIEEKEEQSSFEAVPDADADSRRGNSPAAGDPIFNVADSGGFLSSEFYIEPKSAELHYASPPAGSASARDQNSAHRYSRRRDEAWNSQATKKMSAMRHLKLRWPSTADGDHVEEPEEDKPAVPKYIRKKAGKDNSKNMIGWPGIFLSSVLILVVFACLAVVLFPYEKLVPNVESAFSRAVGRPVRLGSMQVDIYPVAGLVLKNIRVGEGKDEIRIGTIRLQPDLASLFSLRMSFGLAVLSDLDLPLEKIGGLPGIFDTLTAPGNGVSVRKIDFRQTDISFAGLRLKEMLADINVDSERSFQMIDFRSPSGNLHVIAKPAGGKVDVELEAYSWNPYQGAAFFVDSIKLKGKLVGEVFEIDMSELRLADGNIQGSAVIQGSTKPNIAGDMAFERINVARLGDVLGFGKKLVGDASGKMSFQSTADSWSSMLSSVNATGAFSIQRGSITGVDLAEAARRSPGTPVAGGVTSFEQLTGRMKLSPEKNQFSELAMNSGLIQSTGYFDVIPGSKLNGRLELQIKRSLNQTRVPVLLEGTLESLSAQAGRY